jgi:hypothetical protein
MICGSIVLRHEEEEEEEVEEEQQEEDEEKEGGKYFSLQPLNNYKLLCEQIFCIFSNYKISKPIVIYTTVKRIEILKC